MTSTECTTYQRRHSIMSISQAVLNGEKYQLQKRTVILGISPGNPHYYKIETLERLFDLAGRTSEKVSSFYISDPSERITFGACLVNTDELTKRLSKNHPFFAGLSLYSGQNIRTQLSCCRFQEPREVRAYQMQSPAKQMQ